MKHFIPLLLLCCALKSRAQSSDSVYNMSLSFFTATESKEPTGKFLYRSTDSDTLVVFEYKDGRKYLGHILYNSPFSKGVLYYPNGTTYLFTSAPTDDNWKINEMAFHYFDGGVFIGNAYQNSILTGFQFAPDGTYMMGQFKNRKPFYFKTVNYDKDDQRISENYYLKYGDEPTDFETFAAAESKKYPINKDGKKEKAKWVTNDISSYKTKGVVTTVNEETGWLTKTGHVIYSTYRKFKQTEKDITTVSEGYEYGSNYQDNIKYTEPGYNASVSSTLEMYGVGAERKGSGSNSVLFERPRINSALFGSYTHLMYLKTRDGNFYLEFHMDDTLSGYAIKGSKTYTYYGNLENGKYNGWGTYRFADGSYTKAFWKDGQPSGPGKIFNAAGVIIEEGIYESGKLIKPVKNVDLGYYEFIDEFPKMLPRN